VICQLTLSEGWDRLVLDEQLILFAGAGSNIGALGQPEHGVISERDSTQFGIDPVAPPDGRGHRVEEGIGIRLRIERVGRHVATPIVPIGGMIATAGEPSDVPEVSARLCAPICSFVTSRSDPSARKGISFPTYRGTASTAKPNNMEVRGTEDAVEIARFVTGLRSPTETPWDRTGLRDPQSEATTDGRRRQEQNKSDLSQIYVFPRTSPPGPTSPPGSRPDTGSRPQCQRFSLLLIRVRVQQQREADR
jgi:hypothetical protein